MFPKTHGNNKHQIQDEARHVTEDYPGVSDLLVIFHFLT